MPTFRQENRRKCLCCGEIIRNKLNQHREKKSCFTNQNQNQHTIKRVGLSKPTPSKPTKAGENRVVFRTVHKSMPRAAEVMILREDSYWFQDFQLQKLLQTGEGR